MTFSTQTRYLLIAGAVLTASVIQILSGYRLVIVAVAAATFLFVGFLTVYLAGSKERAIRRQQKHDYYAGKS